MKRLFYLLLILVSNLLIGQENIPIIQEGAVKFSFIDDTENPIKIDEYVVIYNNLKNTLHLDSSEFKSNHLIVKPGVYTFHIQTKKFKAVTISNVEIPKDKTIYITIKMTLKKSEKDKSVLRFKYQKPKGEKNCG